MKISEADTDYCEGQNKPAAPGVDAVQEEVEWSRLHEGMRHVGAGNGP